MMSMPRWVYLTKGQPDQSSNTLGHKMSLPGEGQVDILLDSQSASQLQLASQPEMWKNVNQSDFGLVR